MDRGGGGGGGALGGMRGARRRQRLVGCGERGGTTMRIVMEKLAGSRRLKSKVALHRGPLSIKHARLPVLSKPGDWA